MYYHGTNLKALSKILFTQKIECDYFGEKGCFVTKDKEIAELFGGWVIMIPNKLINKNNLSIDDVNDGIYHKGAINIPKNIGFYIANNDRSLSDLEKYLIED